MTSAGFKPVPPKHESHGVILRPLQADQLVLTLAWRNREGVRQRFLNSAVIAPESHQAWFERYQGKPDDVVLLAYLPGRDEPFGQLAIYDIDNARSEAEIGRFVVAPEQAGQGHMRRALACLLDLASTHLCLHVLRLEVLADNLRAIRLYAGLGFIEVGRRDRIVDMRLDLRG
jgi:RimJ/RimL family protein N-acetyltransferase